MKTAHSRILIILFCILFLTGLSVYASSVEEFNPLTISIDNRDLKNDDRAIISVVLNENENDIRDAEIILRNPDKMEYYKKIHLGRVGKNLLEGELYVDDIMPPGNYDIQEVLLLPLQEKIVSSKYNNYFYKSVEYLPENIMTLSNTTSYQPQVEVDFIYSGQLGPNSKMLIRIDTHDNKIEFDECQIELGIQGIYEFKLNKNFRLEKKDENLFEAEIQIHEYFQDGFYSVNTIKLLNKDYEVVVNNTDKNPYDFTEVPVVEGSIPDHSNTVPDVPYYNQVISEGFHVQGTQEDTEPPNLADVQVDSTTISRNGSLNFIITAYDEAAGLSGGRQLFSGGNEYGGEFITLELAGDNRLVGEFKPSPFKRHAGRWTFDILQLSDLAGNFDQFSYGGYDHDHNGIDFHVKGYDYIGEIYGSNRYSTAVEVSKHIPESDTIIITSGADFPDALTAGPIAAVHNSPVLLTKPTGMSDILRSELQKRKPKNVILLGGISAIGVNVENELNNLGINTVVRIAGENRYKTAVSVAYETLDHKKLENHDVDEIYLVNGQSFSDALSISSLAALEEKPILLTKPNELYGEVKQLLVEKSIRKVTIIGGESVIHDSIAQEIEALGITVHRVGGGNRFETSMKILNEYFRKSRNAFVVNGFEFADALTAAPLAMRFNAPIVLVKPSDLPNTVSKYLSDIELSAVDFATVIGGPNAVSDATKNVISELFRVK